MAFRIAEIRGNAVEGYRVQGTTQTKAPDHVVAIDHKFTEAMLIIKLPRATMVACRRGNRRSSAFSHQDNIAGREAVIYATGDRGGFHSAYRGIVETASHEGSRSYVLKDAVRIPRAAWERDYVQRL